MWQTEMLTKIEVLVKKWHFGKIFWWNIEILIKNWKFGEHCWLNNWKFGQKLKVWQKTEILVKNPNPWTTLKWPHYIDEKFIIREYNGTIESYHPYKSNVYRAVSIESPCAALQWKFLEFDLELQPTSCGYDYLTVNYGTSSTGRLCGTTAQKYENWTFHFGHKIEIIFKTDCSNNYYGFKLAWECVDGKFREKLKISQKSKFLPKIKRSKFNFRLKCFTKNWNYVQISKFGPKITNFMKKIEMWAKNQKIYQNRISLSKLILLKIEFGSTFKLAQK